MGAAASTPAEPAAAATAAPAAGAAAAPASAAAAGPGPPPAKAAPGAAGATQPAAAAAPADDVDLEQTPLLGPGEFKVPKIRRINWKKNGLIACYCLAPFVVWLVVVLAWCTTRTSVFAAVAVSALASLFLAGFLTYAPLSQDKEQVARWRAVGGYCVLALIGAVAAGYILRQLYFDPYHQFHYGQIYSNVLAEAPARGHADAGTLKFSIGSKVDVSAAAGFKAGTTYCVAPITNDADNVNKFEYWAVGQDCCAEPRGFHCDNALDADSLIGVVVRPRVSGFFWSLFGPDAYSMYDKARSIAETRYNLVSAKQVMYVRWVKQEHSIQSEILGRALTAMTWTIIFGLIACLLAGASLQMMP
mmetsp:Transcript_36013/g.86715  ORF Transcript_36013/g.86715 Transcript_36013/m.86715 type:complete len:360 (-) Transcript_36013:54-1133(-)